ncbi:hypothetical protein AB7714_06185 [Tardiphaga sp. 1201_B9_N1_1]|uniref:hypothetical protein n=1 Tax=unclassified Tardiphaga TaxID=2631404 RepID=UPI003F25FF26
MPAKYKRISADEIETNGSNVAAPSTPNILPFANSTNPLHWWRSRTPHAFRGKDVMVIRQALLLADPVDFDWMRAITGSSPTAIRIAVEQLKNHRITASVIDDVVSAVLCCALEGNAASSILISAALRRRSKIDPACLTLSSLWLVARL